MRALREVNVMAKGEFFAGQQLQEANQSWRDVTHQKSLLQMCQDESGYGVSVSCC